jgi:hypothetical protein
MRKKQITAAELLARLNADPEWVAARAKEEEERQKRVEEYRRAEMPLTNELKAAGFDVNSAWDLMNKSAPYAAALPILLKHLPRDYPPRVREGIARALAVPDAKFAWSTLVALYRNDKVEDAKDGMAVAIAAISDDSLIGDVISLARDRSLGSSRVLLLSALERSRKPETREVLAELESDPDLHVEARNILHRLA